MKLEVIETASIKFVYVSSVEAPIRTRQDAVSFVPELIDSELAGIAVDEHCFHPDFFDLKTRLAGEIIQMFANYNIKLAVIGDFSKYQSKSLQDLIIECNRGRQVFFVSSVDEAAKYLSH